MWRTEGVEEICSGVLQRPIDKTALECQCIGLGVDTLFRESKGNPPLWAGGCGCFCLRLGTLAFLHHTWRCGFDICSISVRASVTMSTLRGRLTVAALFQVSDFPFTRDFVCLTRAASPWSQFPLVPRVLTSSWSTVLLPSSVAEA